MIKTIAVFLIMAVVTVFGRITPYKDSEIILENGNNVKIENPLGGGSDPWYYEHDGMYYYCYSLGNGAAVAKSETVTGLFSAPAKRVFTAPDSTGYSYSWWAPELHFTDGKWYIYCAADNGENKNHRMYVFTCDTPDGDYTLCGKITDPSDKWAIDGTVLEYNGQMYFIWSGWEGDEDGCQQLYIAHMSSPTQIDSERVLISSPANAWEKKGMKINEGPEILVNDGKVFLVYSASGSWTDDYCLGMLSLEGSDPMVRSSWVKCPVPVLSKAKGAYGPGHCSFFKSEDSQTYIIYHANEQSGTGWDGRSVRIQKVHFVLGYPVFSKPVT